MSVARVLSAIRGALRGETGSEFESLPAVSIPPVPLPGDPPESWRSFDCTRGPYSRFVVSYPRTWQTTSQADSDILHLEPMDTSRAISVTFTVAPVPVAGPQGLLDALELLADSRGLQWTRNSARLDRWGSDAWAASWAWLERTADRSANPYRVLIVGHDQGMVFVTATGTEAEFEASEGEVNEIIASLRLPPAHLLAPEQFPHALCELLNDRRAQNESHWHFSDGGILESNALKVRLWDLYRAYLLDGDLEHLAGSLDARARNEVDSRWAGSTWEEVQGHLRVVLRRRETVGDLPIVQVPIGGELVACPVLDSDDRMTFIPLEESKRWGIEPRDLLTRAVASLDSEGPVQLVELEDRQGQTLNGVLLADEDGYDSGRLLCPRVRQLLVQILGGPLIVAAPAAGMVFVARDDDITRARLTEAAQRAFDRRPRPLSRRLWRWTEGGLELLFP